VKAISIADTKEGAIMEKIKSGTCVVGKTTTESAVDRVKKAVDVATFGLDKAEKERFYTEISKYIGDKQADMDYYMTGGD